MNNMMMNQLAPVLHTHYIQSCNASAGQSVHVLTVHTSYPHALDMQSDNVTVCVSAKAYQLDACEACLQTCEFHP